MKPFYEHFYASFCALTKRNIVEKVSLKSNIAISDLNVTFGNLKAVPALRELREHFLLS